MLRILVKAFTLVTVAAITAYSLTFAADYITSAAEALQKTNVYVAPGTEGTDSNTAGQLKFRLKSNDNVVLIMLPSTATKELESDINSIVSQLSRKLEDQRIIGLAVGKDFIGYAPSLPSGVAEDQMRRADSVSNDPITTLGTFAQNIHIWQKSHPEPDPTATESPSDEGMPWIFWVIILLVLIVLVAGASYYYVEVVGKNDGKPRFSSPSQVKSLLEKLISEHNKVKDRELKETIYQLCVDVDKYFSSSSSDMSKDARFFNERLSEAVRVLLRYIQIQQNTMYYTNPKEELNRGKRSILDFRQYVLEAIKRGNDADLLDYKVDTDILKAQKFR